MSTTNIRYERNAMIDAAHLTSDDGGKCYVFCSIPGGRPWFAFKSNGGASTLITNAPQCATHAEFVTFVSERFGS